MCSPAIWDASRKNLDGVAMCNYIGHMSIQANLLREIENYMRERRMAESKFGLLALNDGRFVPRLRAGANITVATVDRVQKFIAVSETS